MRARTGFGLPYLALLAGCSLFAGEPGATQSKADTAPARKRPHTSYATAALDTGGWAHHAPSPWSHDRSAWRWYHVGLKPSIETADVAAARLRHVVEQGDTLAAHNAAILLARQGDPQGRDKLVELVRDSSTTTSLSTRAAAAEALGRLPSPETAGQLRALYRGLGEGDAWMRAELLRGLARHVSPAKEPLLRDALQDAQAVVRRAAVEAWHDTRYRPLPAAVLRAGDDPDAAVRSAVIDAIGIHRAVDAQSIAETGLHDRDRHVRASAAAALARLNTEHARTLLEGRAGEGEDLDRADAVRALALCGETRGVYRAADDPSWHVRQAAAEAMAGFPNARTAAVLEELIADRSIEVQTTAIDALVDWPDGLAVPVLLRFIADGTFRARGKAHAQLEARWGKTLDAPKTSAPSPWKAFAIRLRQEWKQTHGLIDPARLRGNSLRQTAVETESDLEVIRLLDQLHSGDSTTMRRVVEQLVGFGPSALPAIHRWAEKRPRPLPKALPEQVLPELSPLYAAVRRLGEDETAERQQAAAELAKLVEEQALPLLAAEAISYRLALETDPFVWHRGLAALEQDHVAQAQQAARVGLGHSHALVRRQSCELLARHPSSEQVAWLEPRLRDENPAVRLAAAEALGASGNTTAAPALSRALTTPSKPLRIAAGAALARVGDPKGRDELIRLAYDVDTDIRRQAAVAMGKLGDRAFLPTLIALLDDRQLDVRRAALASLESIAGGQMDRARASDTVNQQVQIEAWKTWWARRGNGGDRN